MPKSNENPKTDDALTKTLKEIGNFLLLVSFPWFIGLSCWYFISTIFRLYKLNAIIFYGIFVVVVPVISLLTNMLIVQAIEWSKQPAGEPSKRPDSKGKRLVKIIITGVLIPIVLSVAANLIPVSGEQTLLTILLNRMKYGTEYPFISKIGDTTIASGIETKIQGVQTLQTIHSSKSLDELFRVFIDDHQSINDYDVYDSLSRAIASFPESRDRLLEMFFKSDEFKSDIPRGVTPNLYDRYFSQAFNNLRSEIKKNIIDPQKRDEQLLIIDDIELQLKSTLLGIENEKYIPEGGDPTLDFVLDTFLQMKIERDDQEIYFLARNIAVDPTYASGTRIRAIALWAKLGTANDFEQIVLLLDNNDEQIRKAALAAIAFIHMKTQNNNKIGNNNDQ